jgi:hypothetical protein
MKSIGTNSRSAPPKYKLIIGSGTSLGEVPVLDYPQFTGRESQVSPMNLAGEKHQST